MPAFSGLLRRTGIRTPAEFSSGPPSYVTKGHLARAVLEATGWQTLEVVDAMNADSGPGLTTLKVDGGMTANHLLMQFLADVIDVPVVRPLVMEAVSLGAAYAAGLAVGYWADLAVLRRNWHRAALWEPKMDSGHRNLEYDNWHRAVERTYDWVRPPDPTRYGVTSRQPHGSQLHQEWREPTTGGCPGRRYLSTGVARVPGGTTALPGLGRRAGDQWPAGICPSPAGLEVLERLDHLGPGVHHERPVPRRPARGSAGRRGSARRAAGVRLSCRASAVDRDGVARRRTPRAGPCGSASLAAHRAAAARARTPAR